MKELIIENSRKIRSFYTPVALLLSVFLVLIDIYVDLPQWLFYIPLFFFLLHFILYAGKLRKMRNWKRHWYTLLLAVITFLGIQYLLHKLHIDFRSIIFKISDFLYQDILLIVLIYVVLTFLAFCFWSILIDFFRKYHNTLKLENSPFVFEEFIFLYVILICAGILWFAKSGLNALLQRFSLSDLHFKSIMIFAVIYGFIIVIRAFFVKPKSNTPQNAGNDEEEDRKQIYNDEPITSLAQEALGRRDFIKGLAKRIHEIEDSHSHVIGLYGSWGEGKSSVLKILRSIFEEKSDYLVVEFDPWYFEDETVLLKNFYKRIENVVCENFLFRDFSKTLNKYVNTILGEHKYLKCFVKTSCEDSLEELKVNLSQYIERTDKKILIIIDDLDRLRENELYSVLKLMRLNAKLNKTLFLASLDKEKVVEKLDKHYLEKIVQHPIQLPTIEEYYLNDYLKKGIKSLFEKEKIGEEEYAVFEENVSSLKLISFLKTLRDVKRYLNSVSFDFPQIKDEVNVNDFLLLEIIRLFAKDVYKDIWSNRDLYIYSSEEAANRAQGNRSAKTKKDIFHKNIAEHNEDILSKEKNKEEIRRVLEFLFPVVAYANNRAMSYLLEKRAKWMSQYRICQYDFFYKYFSLHVSPENISYSNIKAFLSELKTTAMTEKEVYDNICTSDIPLAKLVYLLKGFVPDNKDINNDILFFMLKAVISLLSENINDWAIRTNAVSLLVSLYCHENFKKDGDIKNIFNKMEHLFAKIVFIRVIFDKQFYPDLKELLIKTIKENQNASLINLDSLTDDEVFKEVLWWFEQNKIDIFHTIIPYIKKNIKNCYRFLHACSTRLQNDMNNRTFSFAKPWISDNLKELYNIVSDYTKNSEEYNKLSGDQKNLFQLFLNECKINNPHP